MGLFTTSNDDKATNSHFNLQSLIYDFPEGYKPPKDQTDKDIRHFIVKGSFPEKSKLKKFTKDSVDESYNGGIPMNDFKDHLFHPATMDESTLEQYKDHYQKIKGLVDAGKSRVEKFLNSNRNDRGNRSFTWRNPHVFHSSLYGDEFTGTVSRDSIANSAAKIGGNMVNAIRHKRLEGILEKMKRHAGILAQNRLKNLTKDFN